MIAKVVWTLVVLWMLSFVLGVALVAFTGNPILVHAFFAGLGMVVLFFCLWALVALWAKSPRGDSR